MLETALLCAAIGGRDRLGFTAVGAGFPFTASVPFISDRSILVQNLDLLRAAGLHVVTRAPRVRVAPEDRAFARELLGPGDGPVIALHPFARREARFRAWPLGRYAELITALSLRTRARFLLVGATEDRPGPEYMRGLPAGRVLDAVGTTSLGQTAALLEAATLFVGNDSGLLHLALAVGQPAVGIFGSTPPEQVVGPDADCVPVRTALPCQPCYRHQPFFEIECDHISCLRTLQVEAVLAVVERRLGRQGALADRAVVPVPT
jgi:ADP-heptose:LPS heptosyltransferase